jgi:hypothetical protein
MDDYLEMLNKDEKKYGKEYLFEFFKISHE